MGFRRHCRVEGNSMEPTILSGDLVIYRPINSTKNLLKEGSIVVLMHPLKNKTLIVKRIDLIEKDAIMLLGDNQSRSIDSRQFGLIQKEAIKGIVESIVRTNSSSQNNIGIIQKICPDVF